MRVNCSFDKPAESVCQKSEKFLLKVLTKNLILLSRKKFLKMFIWTRRMQFRQLCRKPCAKSWTCFRTNSGNDRKSNLPRNFISQNVPHET